MTKIEINLRLYKLQKKTEKIHNYYDPKRSRMISACEIIVGIFATLALTIGIINLFIFPNPVPLLIFLTFFIGGTCLILDLINTVVRFAKFMLAPRKLERIAFEISLLKKELEDLKR